MAMQPDGQLPITPPEPPRPPAPTESSQPQQQLLGYDATGQPLYGTPAGAPPRAVTEQYRARATAAESFGTAFQSSSTQPSERTLPQRPRRDDSPRSTAMRDQVKRQHDDSVKRYPNIDLSETEYVVMTVERHSIGMMIPLVGGLILICIIVAGIISYPLVVNSLPVTDPPNVGIIALIGILLAAVVAGFTYMSVWLYRSNKLILTNENLIRDVQVSLFSKRVRMVNLGDVGGVNYAQSGVLQTMLGYGTVNVNTRGNDNIYRMLYAINPRKQVTTIENTVEDYKERFGIDHRF